MGEIDALRQAVSVCQEAEEPEEASRTAQMQEASDDEVIEYVDRSGDGHAGPGRASPSSSSTGPLPADPPGSSMQAAQSSSSQAGPRRETQRTQTRIIKHEEDGGIIEAVYGGGGGTSYCVVDRVQSGNRRTLGEIKLLVESETGDESFRALCKVHKSCSCWINRSGHCDMLLQWLASAHVQSQEKHAQLSKALRQSVGMKVRR